MSFPNWFPSDFDLELLRFGDATWHVDGDDVVIKHQYHHRLSLPDAVSKIMVLHSSKVGFKPYDIQTNEENTTVVVIYRNPKKSE